MKIDTADVASVIKLANLADAERCYAIYASEAARERPILAWSILPLGLSTRRSVIRLLVSPPEVDADDQLYRDYLSLLVERLAQARMDWQAHIAPKGGQEHVH